MPNFKPYCAHCGSVKPDEIKSIACIPCLNQGHWYRLINSEEYRQFCIRTNEDFFKLHGYTESEIKSIPHHQRTLHVPHEALV